MKVKNSSGSTPAEQKRDTTLRDLNDPKVIEETEKWLAEQRKKFDEATKTKAFSRLPEKLPEKYSVLSLAYIDHKPVKQNWGKLTGSVLENKSGQSSLGDAVEQLPKAMVDTEAKPLETPDTAEQPPGTKTALVEQERETSLPDVYTSERREAFEKYLAEQERRFDEATKTKASSYSPDPSLNFDYVIRFIVRKSYLPHRLLDKALLDKPQLLERCLIRTLGERIHDYDCLITHFSYGQRLGDPDKPHEILLSLSDEYIEGLCEQIRFLAGPESPFDAQDLKEAKERIATLTQDWKRDGYFQNEDLAWIAHIGQHIINWVQAFFLDSLRFSASSNVFSTLKHLRYPPKLPPKLSFEDAPLYSPYRFDWGQQLAQLSFYEPYITLFADIIEAGIVKQCPVCGMLFSRPKSERKYFNQQTYCDEKCRKKAEKHRHYEQNKEKLKAMQGKVMKERRKIYKDRGSNYDKKIRGTL